MKKLLVLVFIFGLTFSVTAQVEKETNSTSKYYLIRHAEKDRSDSKNKNPHLAATGIKRAKNWSHVLKHVKFDLVYSTNYNRTKETAIPTAKANNLQIEYYNPRDLKIEEFLEKTKGKTVLIVGHSNTTPTFTNALLGKQKHEPIADDNNSNLYIVSLHGKEKNSTVLVID